MNDNDKSDINADPYQVDFPISLSPEEVLRAVIVDMKPPLASIDGSVGILAEGTYKEITPEVLQWMQRCSVIMRRVVDAAETYLEIRKKGS